MGTYPTEKVFFQFPAGLRVLAVDHDTTILDVIKKMCFRCHYRAVTYSDASLALNYVREKKDCIDVILIEVHMPYGDSYEFLQHVTVETNIPVIMMSLDDAKSTVMKAIIDGACDYRIKPLHENQFKIMWKHVARKLWSKNQLPKKEDSEYVASYVLDSTVMDPEKIGSNFKDSDSYEPGDSFAPPAKKPRVRNIDIIESKGRAGAYGVTLKQNEKALQNYIESKGREGAYGRFDSIAFGDTSHVLYAALHPEGLTSNVTPREEDESFPSITKCSNNVKSEFLIL
ncbi:two-component response regulator ORR21-like [Glycine soja]|uniref:two-component response regulator ORR21 n=1 Tax=Glycine max TaxID=3847 RepID=UPI0003DEBA2E|nr:two-component response regulator ORR21 [Glycine max]XP_028230825.1 two-component response regulator ORR21-like [Glycine soja]|eukprot:XP_006580820.1 two-component response regulator ORR21 [Glycine max]